MLMVRVNNNILSPAKPLRPFRSRRCNYRDTPATLVETFPKCLEMIVHIHVGMSIWKGEVKLAR